MQVWLLEVIETCSSLLCWNSLFLDERWRIFSIFSMMFRIEGGESRHPNIPAGSAKSSVGSLGSLTLISLQGEEKKTNKRMGARNCGPSVSNSNMLKSSARGTC